MRVSQDARLDVLLILGNVSLLTDLAVKEQVQKCLQGVSEWFDEFLYGEEGSKKLPNEAGEGKDGEGKDGEGKLSLPEDEDDEDDEDEEEGPELHKAMLVLLCRAYNYKLKTEHLLEVRTRACE